MPQKHNMSSVERVVFPAIMLVAQQALHALRIQTGCWELAGLWNPKWALVAHCVQGGLLSISCDWQGTIATFVMEFGETLI
jgi:hypothetical protein